MCVCVIVVIDRMRAKWVSWLVAPAANYVALKNGEVKQPFAHVRIDLTWTNFVHKFVGRIYMDRFHDKHSDCSFPISKRVRARAHELKDIEMAWPLSLFALRARNEHFFLLLYSGFMYF